jgi:hypothetical protein
MKIRILLNIVLLLITTNSFSQQKLQYFDGADTIFNDQYYGSLKIIIDTSSTNIWQIGKPQKVIFDSAATLPNAIITDTINYYPINNISRFYLGFKTNYFNPFVRTLKWKQKLDLDSNFDGGIVEYSVDSGSTWVNVMNNPNIYNFYGFNPINKDTLPSGQFCFSGKDTTWKEIWVCFSPSWLTLTDSIAFRFTLKTDSINNNKEGWLIDNFRTEYTWMHTAKTVAQKNYLHIFPNPATDILNIEAERILGYHIIENMKLYDVNGRILQEWKMIPTKFFINTKNYNVGQYFLKIRTNKKSQTIPFSIKR